MSRVIVKRAACAVLSVSLVGCASVHSQRINGKGEGLVYFLPKQDFVLTVTMKQKVVETATLSETPAYPDLTQQFVAAAAYPLLTKNLVQIEVDKNGLLHNATKSGITSQVDSVLNAAASAAGTLGAATKMTVAPELKKMECTDNGSNVYVFSPESSSRWAPFRPSQSPTRTTLRREYGPASTIAGSSHIWFAPLARRISQPC
jgi:hypothetical protein